jgi:hypothetical protein
MTQSATWRCCVIIAVQGVFVCAALVAGMLYVCWADAASHEESPTMHGNMFHPTHVWSQALHEALRDASQSMPAVVLAGIAGSRVGA